MRTRFRLGLLVALAVAVSAIVAALVVAGNEREAFEIGRAHV